MKTITAIRERPILFRGDLVRAILEKHRDGLTHVEIASFLGLKSKYYVAKICKAHGAIRPAKRRPGKGVGKNNPAWRGGRRIRRDGYVLIWTPTGERLEHQVVMERHLGRKLVAGEIVHHRDRNKKNNSIVNLELTTQSEHIREHLADMHRARFGR